MTGRFVISDHALVRFQRRFSDHRATRLDLGRMLAEAKVTTREMVGGKLILYAVLEDACFVCRKESPGEYVVLTVMRLDREDCKYRVGLENVA